MYKIELTQQDLNNLKIFLSRTTLSGKEALGFVKLADKIENAKVVEKDGK